MRSACVLAALLLLPGAASSWNRVEEHTYQAGNGMVGVAVLTCGQGVISNATEIADACFLVGQAKFVQIEVKDASGLDVAASWRFHAGLTGKPLTVVDRDPVFCAYEGTDVLPVPADAHYLSVKIGPAGAGLVEKTERCGKNPGTAGVIRASFI